MNNGASAGVIAFFDSISDMPDRWNHNSHYHERILKLAGRRELALDLGCGTGGLTRELALRCSKVVGIDVSAAMIGTARSRNWGLDIEYLVADAHRYLEGRREEFDLIVSVAALHHMDEERMLALAKEALRPGGMLIVLDLYRPSSIADRAASSLGLLLHPLYSLSRNGRLGVPRSERELWSRHSPDDEYKTLPELRLIARSALGAHRLERTIFWRYILSYEKVS